MRYFLRKDFGLTGSTTVSTSEIHGLILQSDLGQREWSYHSALLCYWDTR